MRLGGNLGEQKQLRFDSKELNVRDISNLKLACTSQFSPALVVSKLAAYLYISFSQVPSISRIGCKGVAIINFWMNNKMATKDALETLQKVFGFAAFRGAQLCCIEAILRGESAACVFPTGAGKSICYQLSAVLLEHLTVVVSALEL